MGGPLRIERNKSSNPEILRNSDVWLWLGDLTTAMKRLDAIFDNSILFSKNNIVTPFLFALFDYPWHLRRVIAAPKFVAKCQLGCQRRSTNIYERDHS